MTEDEPLGIVEDADTGDRFLVYQTAKGPRLDIRFAGESLWLSQQQIAQLFGKDISSVSRHIANVLAEGELDEASSLQKVQTTPGRPATLYSLDMVISVGYRVSSTQATVFRRWATAALVQYARKGFVVDKARLKQPNSSDRIAELREIIRDIRSDEANLYAELRQICSLCQDYDSKSDAAAAFFRETQAKLVYAVVSQTPSEIILSRSNARSENMGLTTWPNDNIRKADVKVSKNYLSETEMKELNRLTTILLDIFEDQLDLGRIIVMNDASQLLDRQLKSLGRAALSNGGRVPRGSAENHALAEYEKYTARKKQERLSEADAAIAELVKEERELPRGNAANPYPRSTPPVALATASTMRFDTASISSSVSVLSRRLDGDLDGDRLLAFADRRAFEHVEHEHVGNQLLVGASRRAR